MTPLVSVFSYSASAGLPMPIRPPGQQGPDGFINDPALADAILDRLIHSSHKLTLKVESMRKQKASG